MPRLRPAGLDPPVAHSRDEPEWEPRRRTTLCAGDRRGRVLATLGGRNR